ncbi:MAG TPA: hypothetical protein VFQ22_01245, partial [Longimicrobiales bacterium]|nr:hypothetical protein [Longimicrobiales bacterium]
MKPVGAVALRALVTLLAVLATVAQVAYLDALSWHSLGLAEDLGTRLSPALLTLMTAHAVVSIASAALAVMLILHEGIRAEAARALGLALGAWGYLMAYSGVTLLLRPRPGVPRSLFEAHFLAVEMAGLAGLLRFSTLFPVPLASHAAGRWMVRPAAPGLAAAAVLAALWGTTAALGLPIADAGLSPLADLARFAAVGLVVWNLWRAWARAGAEDAGRLAYLLLGLACLLGALLLFIGGNVLLAVTGWREPVVAWRPLLMDLGVLGLLLCAAGAVLHRGAFDARRAARRVAAFSAVATLALFLAAALEGLLTRGVIAGISVRTGVGTVIALTLVISSYRSLMRAAARVLV